MEKSTQNGITLHIVEEIAPKKYESIDTFTFLLHRLTKKQQEEIGDGVRTIVVGMSMDVHGKFVISVYDEYDPDHVRKRKQFLALEGKGHDGFIVDEDTTWTVQEVMLISFCVFLFSIYVILKMHFSFDEHDIEL